MTATDRRIDNLFDGLTARERAVLAIQAWKEDRYEPPGLRRRIPPGQDDEFYDLLNHSRGLGLLLSVVAPIWRQSLATHSTRYGWLLTLELTEIYVSSLSSYIVTHTREQITESQHAKLVDQERAQLLPLADLADLLVDENQEWADPDLEDGYISDRAYARVKKEKAAQLRKLFDEGTIVGRRKGKSIELNLGSFYDWLGEAVPICPEWALDLEIVPDDQEEKVRCETDQRNHARSIVQRALNGTTARRMGEKPSEDDLYAAVERQLIGGVIADSREIRAADRLVAELQQRLGGEDPIDPEVRKTLDSCRRELAGILEALGVDADEAIEDCEADMKMMREFIGKHR